MYNFKEIEESAGKIWHENKKEIKRTLQYDPKKQLFSFLEGPPTANAPPALHHVEVRVFKDLVCRFKYMQGFTVPRKAGWDCHGLPVEVQIEKLLKLNSKKEIVNYGTDKFIEKCRESVFSYIQDWNKMTEKMAYWVDLDEPYITLENKYIESVWWSLKQLYDRKILYEGHKVVPYCPRCETPLSSHEVAQGYQDVKEPAVTVKMKISGKKDRYFLVWTTTPWTLPSNMGLAINEKTVYAVVKEGSEEYILAESLVEKFFSEGKGKIIDKIVGKKLIGLEYEPIFDYFADLKKKGAFKVIQGNDFVTNEEGTGIVHMAPAFGEVDYEACNKNKIPFVQPVTSEGKFADVIPEFAGQFVKSADIPIIKVLAERGILFKKENYTHSYPFCWRCSTPLIYYALKSWFVKVSDFREDMIKNNEKINWFPKDIKEGRFGEWIKNAKDWALSRFKFWGTPLPIWRCSCGEELCIGSIEDLKKAANLKKEIDLHKPYIDQIEIKCAKCKKKMARIPDVIDCWYDSGSASFAQFHYPFENKDLFKKRFPYNFIAEAIDQTRGWFYTLHVLSTILFNDLAYKNCVCAGLLVDEKGEKMSKSKGNIINPGELFEKVGVDAVRLQMCFNNPGDTKRVGESLIRESVLPFLTILYNCSVFSKDSCKEIKKPKLAAEDEWIISRMNSLVKNFTEELEKNNYHINYALLKGFVENDFSRFYIKLIRDRNEEDAVAYTLNYIFERLPKLTAPFIPYISEMIYQDTFKGKKEASVHFEKWPEAEEKNIEKSLEEDMEKVKKIIELGLSEREKAQAGLKWPLQSATIHGISKKSLDKFNEIVKKQLNIKEITVKEGSDLTVELDTKMTPELEAEGFAREITRKIQDSRKKAGLKKEQKISLNLEVDSGLEKMIKPFLKELQEKTGIIKLEVNGKKQHKNVFEDKIKDKKVKISLDIA